MIAVLWIVSILAIMAASSGSSSRNTIKLAFNATENAKARMLADAGVQRAIFDMLTGADQPWQADGTLRHSLALGDDRVRVQVRDEDGKIDLNAASPEVLQGLFRAVGQGDEQAGTLAGRVGDFRDKDDDRRPNGAEDVDYEAAGLLGGAADRPFRQIEELADVLGMTKPIYESVRPYVTIYAETDGVDPLRASRTALMALPGMTTEALEAILQNGRTEDQFLGLPDDLLIPIEDYLLPSRDLVFEIRALGESGQGGRFMREAIIALDGGREGALSYTIYAWRHGSQSSME